MCCTNVTGHQGSIRGNVAKMKCCQTCILQYKFIAWIETFYDIKTFAKRSSSSLQVKCKQHEFPSRNFRAEIVIYYVHVLEIFKNIIDNVCALQM